jgi:two-component system OmpR family response regulator
MKATKILLADDNISILAKVGEALRREGYAVTSTNSGADAMCLMSAIPGPDLLILDLLMPGMNGHEVLKSLGPSAPPVIVITGDDVTLEDFVHAKGKVRRVVVKPFDFTDILTAVRDTLGVRLPAGGDDRLPDGGTTS